jgi:TetR/AcrR family transcriptional regulator, transcriptional repressor for nem operon
MPNQTKELLLQSGMAMLLERGYSALGIQALLDATGVPKGSFYHYFKSKEDFALQAIDSYMQAVHQGLDFCLHDESLPPLERIRKFFTLTEAKYRDEGHLGCLLGGLGQELSGTSEVFRAKLRWCFAEIVKGMAGCLEEARQAGDLAPEADPQQLATLLVDCWEGAALRSRLLRDPGPLQSMLDFYFRTAAPPRSQPSEH